MATSDGALKPAGSAIPDPTRVLIIDDHEGTLETYSTILRVAGFEAASAVTGAQGLALAKARAFDVILVDLRLPDMSGVDVVRELRRHQIGGHVVVVTAFPSVESSFDVGAAGAAGYVDGPLFGEEVIDVVAQACEGLFPVQHPRTRTPVQRAGVSSAIPLAVIDPRVRATIRLIDSDLARRWQIGDLAASVALSESRLRHLFRASLGMSVSENLLERRLSSIARRLSTTSDDIRQIAYSAGLTDSRDFRRAFRKRFGMSPREYRKRCAPG